MKILQVVPAMTDNSINHIVEMILMNQHAQEMTWFVAGPAPEEYTKRFAELNADVMYFAYDENGNHLGKLASIKQLRNYIKEKEIDLIHSHTPTTTVLSWFASQNIPVSRIYTKHLLTYPKDRKFGLIYTMVDRISLYLTDHIMPVSETMAEIIKGYPLLNDSEVSAIQNAIDFEYYNAPQERPTARQELGVQDSNILFGFTGRLEKMKRLPWLLDCFQQVVQNEQEARLAIIGEGSLQQELEDYAKQLGISDKVIFTGWRGDVPRVLAALDVYVQPSSNEGLSLSVLEAMSAGNAIVATDVGGIQEIIENGVSGIIVPPSDMTGFASAMIKMVSDSEKRKQMAETGKKLVWERFNMERMTNLYFDIYTKYAK